MKKIIMAALLSLVTLSAQAQSKLSIFMDAEINAWFEDMAKPLLKAADISPSQVKVYLAHNKDINAFAAPDGTIVFYSGMILRADNESEIRGVLAHEIGHIKAKHYVKSRVKQETETVPSIIGTILGLGAAAAGAPQAATGLILGGLSATQVNILSHSRTHEWEADKIAIELLSKSESNLEGFASFFQKLRNEQLLYSKTPPEYLLTHPLSSARMDAANEAIKTHSAHTTPINDENRFKRVQAKIRALTSAPKVIQRIYALEETVPAIYARTVALALEGKTQSSLDELHKIENWQTDPYFNELAALLYLDMSKMDEAQQHYNKALTLSPENALIAYGTATTFIARDEEEKAIPILRKLLLQEPKWPSILHQLGIAYGKIGHIAESHLFLAQEALLKKDKSTTKLHLGIAQTALNQNNNTDLTKKLQHIKNLMKELE